MIGEIIIIGGLIWGILFIILINKGDE